MKLRFCRSYVKTFIATTCLVLAILHWITSSHPNYHKSSICLFSSKLTTGHLENVVESFQGNGYHPQFCSNFRHLAKHRDVNKQLDVAKQRDVNKPESEVADERDVIGTESGSMVNNLIDRYYEDDDVACVKGWRNEDVVPCDVIWTYDYPFDIIQRSGNGQKLNHFPFLEFMTDKQQLSLIPLPFIPKSYKISNNTSQLQRRIKSKPKNYWVIKTKKHKGIRIINSISDVDFGDRDDIFVQEFIADALLIANRMFDIGVYVAIISRNPIVAYAYTADWLLRFCKTEFLPFDSSDVSKYVIDDDYLSPNQLPGFDLNDRRTNIEMLGVMLSGLGSKVSDLQRDLHQSICRLFAYRDASVGNINPLPLDKYFELLRFDFLVDRNMNVHLMEANMSPNLSSKKRPRNKGLYMGVLDSLIRLIHTKTIDLLTTEENNSVKNMLRICYNW